MFGSRFYLNKLRQIRVECYNSLHSALLVLGLVLAVQKGEIGVAIFFANCMFSHRFLLSSLTCTTFDQVRRYILERKFCQMKEGKKEVKKVGNSWYDKGIDSFPHRLVIVAIRDSRTGGEGGQSPPPSHLGRSVNHISTRGGILCPPQYW